MELLFSPLGLLLTGVVLLVLLFAANEPIRGLVTMVTYGVAASLATMELVVVGFGVALLLMILVPRALRDRRNLARFEGRYYRSPVDWAFAAIGIIAVIHLVVGVLRRNELRFVGADFFHIMFEMTIPYFVFKIYFNRYDNLMRFLEGLWRSMLVVSIILLILLITGWIRLIPGAGNVMAHTNFWRFNYSHHYPLNPLLLFTAILVLSANDRVDRWLGASVLVLFITLGVSLKRASWLAYVTCAAIIPFVISQRSRLRVGGVLLIAGAAFGVAVLVAPPELFEPLTEGAIVGRATSMGKGTVEFGNRFEQASRALELIAQNPMGYGMGSVLETLKGEETHYVHNTFLHYALLGSVFLPFLITLVLIRTIIDGFVLYRRMPDGVLRGAVLGSVIALLAMIQTGMTEVTVNTYFFAAFPAIVYSARAIHERYEAEQAGGTSTRSADPDRPDIDEDDLAGIDAGGWRRAEDDPDLSGRER
jgi:hypothetical protein